MKFPRHTVAAEEFKMIEMILFRIIATGLMHNLVKVYVPFFGFRVHVQHVLLNLTNIGYQIVLHNLNKVMPVLKVVTI